MQAGRRQSLACAEGDGGAGSAARAGPRLPRQERLVSRASARCVGEGCHPFIEAQIVQQCSPAYGSCSHRPSSQPACFLIFMQALSGDKILSQAVEICLSLWCLVSLPAA